MTESAEQKELREAAQRKQWLAADPAVSAWVRANAGTGKTHVLVQRILRLFLSGADPRSVLCLTFTKNAAAEMEGRVLKQLGDWATAEDEALAGLLAKLLARPPSQEEAARARSLFASVIDAPGGLAIMTIHGFCERVLRRYSFEANVPPGFKVLTEEEAREALSEAMAQVFAAKTGPLRDALSVVVAYAGQEEFSGVLQAMLGQRHAIARLLQVSAMDDPFADIEARLRRLFHLGRQDTKESLLTRAASLLDGETLIEAIAALSCGLPSDIKSAAKFQAVMQAANAEQKVLAFRAVFATASGEPRKSLMTASVRRQSPALHDHLVKAQLAFLALDRQICGAKVVEASMALLRLAAAIFERYEAAKQARAAVDFDGLIAKTLSLFSREDAASWVLYQLDARLDHILVDEAQDTSPEQWQIIEKLTSDFFSGEGARECVPTVFAVGDEKQSIYGFQGARPELLARNGAFYEARVDEAGFRWRPVTLDLSFRTLAPVLLAADSVTEALPDLRAGGYAPHTAYRRHEGGLVELWEPERGEREDKGTVWEAGAADAPAPKPDRSLAARIAEQIKHWLGGGHALPSAGRAIEPGDILILLRKREPMAGLLQAALKREGIPVSGADRVALLDELAVKDLLSLAGAMLQPEDDLALAGVLKSPLFGFSDGDLFELSYGRGGSLWQALETGSGDRTAQAAARLACWRELARQSSPFGFFAHILEAEGGRDAFAARLGSGCFDALDELLNLAEAFGARPQASLAEFLVSLRQGAAEVKRETDQATREVRIMTVHAAKGLEANIVILADACGARSASPVPVFPMEDGAGAPIPVWAVKGSSALSPIAAVKEELGAAERRELGRLLYVAMTRARDRLYIAGFHHGNLPAGCWYETIRTAFASKLQQAEDFQRRPVWRHGSVPQGSAAKGSQEAALETPPWFPAPALPEPALPIVLPSQFGWASKGEWEAVGQGTGRGGPQDAKAYGILIHRLLEVLPALDAPMRPSAAAVIARAFTGMLSARETQDAIGNVLAFLSAEVSAHPAGHSLAEAGLAAALQSESGKPLGILLGQADRISFSDSGIDILDYKSGTLNSGTIPHFQAQLAAYSFVLRQVYPDARIQAALIGLQSKTVAQGPDAERG